MFVLVSCVVDEVEDIDKLLQRNDELVSLQFYILRKALFILFDYAPIPLVFDEGAHFQEDIAVFLVVAVDDVGRTIWDQSKTPD